MSKIVIDVIALEDMIGHYCTEMDHSLEELKNCRAIMEKMNEMINCGWTGPSAGCFENKLRECEECQRAAEKAVWEMRNMLQQILAMTI